MLSRTLLRSLPRTVSRNIAQCTRSSLRPTLQSSSIIRSTAPQWRSAITSRAAFSTTAARFDDVAQELAAKLTNEIALEDENSESQADSDAGVKKFLEENDHWVLEAPEGQQDVVLRRQYDDELITVAFSVVDFNTAMPLDDEVEDDAFLDEEDDMVASANSTKGTINQAGGKNPDFKVAPEDSIAASDMEDPLRSEEDYDDSQQAFPANVNVLIQRAGKGALRVSLVADNGRFTVQGVTHLPETSPAATASDLIRHTPEQLYTGPPFQQLDEELQGLLEQYLDVRGINTALALFIPDYIDVKEQKEYVGWLGRVKDFVD